MYASPHLHRNAFLLPFSEHAADFSGSPRCFAAGLSLTFPIALPATATAAAAGSSILGSRERTAAPPGDDDEADAPIQEERRGLGDVRAAGDVQRFVLNTPRAKRTYRVGGVGELG